MTDCWRSCAAQGVSRPKLGDLSCIEFGWQTCSLPRWDVMIIEEGQLHAWSFIDVLAKHVMVRTR